jgi:FlaA1/EpsC-like NDP-sugar epimerase
MVRFGNVLGSSGSVLEIWSREIADGGPLTVTDPAMTRYFMTIAEAAALVIQAAALVDEDTAHGEVFLLDMGEPVRILDLAKRFVAMHGLEPILPGVVRPKPACGVMQIVYTGARRGEKLHEELAFDAEAMRPTRHPDINIWEVPPPDADYLDAMVADLTGWASYSHVGGSAAVAEAVRRWLPEFAPAGPEPGLLAGLAGQCENANLTRECA